MSECTVMMSLSWLEDELRGNSVQTQKYDDAKQQADQVTHCEHS